MGIYEQDLKSTPIQVETTISFALRLQQNVVIYEMQECEGHHFNITTVKWPNINPINFLCVKND